MLDNRRDTLPEAVGFKLDYARNRMQAFIDQMLYYARLRGARRDYRFERLTLRSCIDEVLDDYRPLLEEKASGSRSGLRTRPYSPTGAGCVSCSGSS